MIVEYLTESGEWKRDVCRHEVDDTTLPAVHTQTTIGGHAERRTAAPCRLCGVWIPVVDGGLFTSEEN